MLVDSTPPAASGNTNGAPFVTVLPRSVDGSLMPPSAPLTQSDASSVTLKFPTLGDDESGVNAAYTVTVIVNSGTLLLGITHALGWSSHYVAHPLGSPTQVYDVGGQCDGRRRCHPRGSGA